MIGQGSIVTYTCKSKVLFSNSTTILNQVHAWFLEIAFVREVSMSVCVTVFVCVRPQAIKNYSREMSLNSQ